MRDQDTVPRIPVWEPRWAFVVNNVKVKAKQSRALSTHTRFCLLLTATNINSNLPFLVHTEQKGETVK